MTTLPLARPCSTYAIASRVWSNGNVLSMSGRRWPASKRRQARAAARRWPERVQHDVVAGEDLGEVLLPVVHDDVRAEASHQLRVLAARGRGQRGAEVLGERDDSVS